ncbi:PRD domain-containing protein [Companilactobacillus zhachilii]|uniref:PRD domain-containing protein n=1 Tax=Companilactobacillus zhachilii TaxID=2304606 RepID=UPI001921A3C1|nr:PRD domain-containing protein [Companilactobacillus zhachilii]MBL3531313.1 PRD domain-containing protein [Companilactobacillus zhachilii]
MKIKKVLNSSVVLAVNDRNQEFILLGKGIGYGKKMGTTLDSESYNQVFVPVNNANVEQLLTSIAESSPKLIEIAQKIISHASESLNSRLSDALYVSLLDHLKFAIEREEKGITITNKVYWEIKTYYSKEFSIGTYAVKLLNSEMNTNFSDQEASNIAANIINAENESDDRRDALKAGQVIGRIVNIIKYQLQGSVNDSNANFQRCVVHVKFLVERIIANVMFEDVDAAIFEIVKSKDSKAFQIAENVSDYIKIKFGEPLTKEELMLMAMQIHRIG